MGRSPRPPTRFRSAWTYGRFRFHNDAQYDDNRIAGLPPHLIRAELTWENSRGYYAGPTCEWVPVKSYIDHRNTFSAALRAAWIQTGPPRRCRPVMVPRSPQPHQSTPRRHTGVIENAGGVDQRQFLPGDGRSFFAGLEWKW